MIAEIYKLTAKIPMCHMPLCVQQWHAANVV